MKLAALLKLGEQIDLRPDADSSYPTKKFDYEEWKKMGQRTRRKYPPKDNLSTDGVKRSNTSKDNK